MRELTRFVPSTHINKLTKSKPGKKETIIVTTEGCESCEDAKKKGMCKDTKCVDIFSKKGKEIDKKIDGIDYFPFCIVKESNGSFRPCNESEGNKAIPE